MSLRDCIREKKVFVKDKFYYFEFSPLDEMEDPTQAECFKVRLSLATLLNPEINSDGLEVMLGNGDSYRFENTILREKDLPIYKAILQSRYEAQTIAVQSVLDLTFEQIRDITFFSKMLVVSGTIHVTN